MPGAPATARPWLRLGLAAAPVYLTVGALQMLLREGFDPRLHALSLLSNGAWGWVQVVNFILTGLLVLAGAIGIRKVLHPGRAGTWGPVLLAVYGLGLIGAGVFPADPGNGFPPGVESPVGGMTGAGLMHFVAGAIGFYALIAATFVLAARFQRDGWRGLAAASIATGVLFLVAFGAIACGPASPAVMLGFYAAVVTVWVWYAAVLLALIQNL